MSDFSFDLTGVIGTQEAAKVATNSTNKKAGSDLVMDDFLKLMVAQFQNQSIDNTADTTEMMNQMVQMSVIQAITNLSTLVTDSTNLSYAASLVGKEVTIGQRNGSEVEELLGIVTGTGTLNGKQVIFLDGQEDPFYLTDIMAVGRLPEIRKSAETEADTARGSGWYTDPTTEANPVNDPADWNEVVLEGQETRSDETDTQNPEQDAQVIQEAQAAQS